MRDKDQKIHLPLIQQGWMELIKVSLFSTHATSAVGNKRTERNNLSFGDISCFDEHAKIDGKCLSNHIKLVFRLSCSNKAACRTWHLPPPCLAHCHNMPPGTDTCIQFLFSKLAPKIRQSEDLIIHFSAATNSFTKQHPHVLYKKHVTVTWDDFERQVGAPSYVAFLLCTCNA